MPRIAIFYCKRIKDHSCDACAKCFKAIAEKSGEFARYDSIDLAAMTDCGDCPGLIVPRANHVVEALAALGREVDVLHFGTCMKAAMNTAQCPIDVDDLRPLLEQHFGVKVVLGTHG